MIKLLVPVSFSDYSLNALTFALTLAEKFPAEITVLHCFTDYMPRDEAEGKRESSSVTRAEIDQKESAGKKELKQLANRQLGKFTRLREKNITLKYRFEHGYPEDIIPVLSNNEGFDVVIMGTQTKGEPIKEALGSVTSDVIQRTTAPVLAVPSQSSIDPNNIGKILFLLELSDNDYISLHRLIRLISPFHTEINAVLHCPAKADKNDIRKMDELRSYCDSTYPHYDINFAIITGKNYVKSIEEYVAENPVNLVAMTRRKRTLLRKIFTPSITRRFLFSSKVPLLVFHS
jgi:nucleotide-binding universal stress UspA family protein